MTTVKTSESEMPLSNVEDLLKEMSLREPSDTLDDRVTNCLKHTRADKNLASAIPMATGGRESGPRESGSWRLLSLIAAACLLLGMALGRMTVSVGAIEAVSAAESGSTVVRVDGPQDRLSAEVRDFSGEVSGQNFVINVGDIPEDVLREQFPAPAVAMFCSLGAESAHGEKRDQCLKCHKGVPDAKSAFRRMHMSMLQSELCATCHVAARDEPVQDIDDSISGYPWRELPPDDSPTG